MATGYPESTYPPAAAPRGLHRQRVRALPVPELERRPVRQAVWGKIDADRRRLDLTQDQYAERLGGSGSTLSRFRRGQGKLSKVMSARLLELHPGWKRLLTALVLEDALHDGTLGAATSD